MDAPSVTVRPLQDADRAWAQRLLLDSWGSTRVVSRGVLHDTTTLPGLIAWHESERAGLLLYRIDGAACEVVVLDSVIERIGAGSALMAAAQETARAAGCTRLWLITTNDNVHALRFYQRRGMRLAALHRDALAESRRIKPEIPLIGMDGIPLRDEIELEIAL
jgi:GNAT superfamily N-acetyltransferase